MPEVTEFADLDPEEFHLVPNGATGFPVLLAKAAEMVSDEVEKDRMDAKERHGLDDSDFAFPKQRKEPINDAAHVRAAMSRFDQVEGVSDAEKKEAARRILARAKHFGIDVSEDSNVALAAKQTAPDKAVPRSEAESQTDEVSEDVGSGDPPEPDDGGEPTHQGLADDKPPEATGQGDTAPDKDLHRSEAESQTPGAQSAAKADLPDAVNGTGSAAPDGEEEARQAEEEAQTQTREVEKADADSDPGSPAWEHKDVSLGERAEALASQLVDVVHEFTQREKAEGGASKSLRRAARTARSLLKHPDLIRKAAENMTDTRDALTVLGEYDAARRAEKKAEQKAQKAKAQKAAEKAERNAAKAAEKAAKAAGDSADDVRLAKALDELNTMRETVEKMASEDGKRVVLNGTGLAAILRDPVNGADAMKQIEDRFAQASEAYEKTPNSATKAAMVQAGQQRFAAKLIAGERHRETSLEAVRRTQLGMGNPLISSTTTHGLVDDRAVDYR